MLAVLFDLGLSTFMREVRGPSWVQAAARFLEKATGSSVLNGDVVKKVQFRRLRQTIEHVYRHSPFYREALRAQGITPGAIRTLSDLQKLPFTTSRDISQWQQFLCTPEDQLTTVFTTSGTTGEPKRVYFTYREMRTLANFAAVALRFRYPGRLIVLIALPLAHGLWIGSAIAQRVVEQAGGLALPVGAGDPEETLKWMKRFTECRDLISIVHDGLDPAGRAERLPSAFRSHPGFGRTTRGKTEVCIQRLLGPHRCSTATA